MNRIWVALTNDWELRGNGLGSVLKLQYEPTVKLIQIYKKLKIKATFTVEVMQQLAFLKYADKYTEIKQEAQYWQDAVLLMKKEGFDVQLHIHPQWHNAEYDGRFWKLDRRWNIADYTPQQIDAMFRQSLAYLKSLLPGHPLTCFRAGSWAVYPSRPIFETMERHGIKLDVSVVNGVYYEGESVKLDYRNLESPYKPYYPDYNDSRKVAKVKTGVVELPTQSVLDEDFTLPQGIISRIKRYIQTWTLDRFYEKLYGLVKKEETPAPIDLPDHVIQDPFGVIKGVPTPYNIMDLSRSLPYYMWKLLVDIVMRRALKDDTKIIVFENHPKDYVSREQYLIFQNTLSYIKRKYKKNVEFVTLHEVAENIDKIQPILKK